VIESLAVTALPALFLALLYGSEAVLRFRRTFSSGEPPIGRTLFACCKYAIVIPWGAMVLHGWGVRLSVAARPDALKWPALGLWVFGFGLLFLGRLRLGSDFRIGLAREKTRLKEGGVYRLSRNPMYLGIDATLAAAALYTLNPIVIAVGVFIAAVHHKIALAEEARLKDAFGESYVDYCRRVRRYL
jgi:protein-S-isoprenylcysteine O-methyltransferase Ste14